MDIKISNSLIKKKTNDCIRVGYIKYLNHKKKYGFIRQWHARDIYFNYNNIKIKDFNNICERIVVGYYIMPSQKYQNEFEAINVDIAENYTNEFRLAKNNYYDFEWKMVLKGNDVLLYESLGYNVFSKVKLKENLIEHVETTNIDELINMYQIKLESGGRCKPGDDDTAWVYLGTKWLPNEFSTSIQKKYIDDVYIRELLPDIHKVIYSETAFTPYGNMIVDFYSNKKRIEKLEFEAQQMEIEIKKMLEVSIRKRNTNK